uniref:Uncharacterized protein n=1 Tax=Peronospora matthiolae TaxID=2874970 RepID=A0AAV1TN26_9STRA
MPEPDLKKLAESMHEIRFSELIASNIRPSKYSRQMGEGDFKAIQMRMHNPVKYRAYIAYFNQYDDTSVGNVKAILRDHLSTTLAPRYLVPQLGNILKLVSEPVDEMRFSIEELISLGAFLKTVQAKNVRIASEKHKLLSSTCRR